MQDTNPTAGRVADPGIRALYQLESRWQSWIDVEVALAQAQAKLGIIPAAAAERIAEIGRLDLLDRARIDEATRRTSHPIVPLVWEMGRVAGEEYGGWVHWGATTQNIVQTGDLLTLRKAHRTFLDLLGRSLESMADLAERTADYPMPGRTHGQHAVPITFGFKVAVWIDEFSRHVERLTSAEHRVFVALLGGAAGTFASMGEEGPATQNALGEILGLQPMDVPARSIGDHLAEYVTLLGLLSNTVTKVAREIYTLMKTEFGEVEEPMPDGTVGSSTMPQKRNPQLCQDIIAKAAVVRSAVPLAFDGMQMEHEADRSRGLMMQEATELACVATGDMLSRMAVVLAGLKVFPERMRKNLDLSHGLIMSEAVMMKLGETFGRQAAHDIVYEAAQEAALESTSFEALLAADPRVSAQLGAEDIADILDPVRYVGLCADMARAAAVRGRAAAERAFDHETESR